MGEVYRARDTRLDRAVAIKVLPAALRANNAQLTPRFEREARSISSLSHPHICTLYDVGSEDGVDYLVMELLEGETLADALARGPLPIERRAALRRSRSPTRSTARIAPASSIAISSRATSCSRSRGAKLLDFGLAKSSAWSQPSASGDATTTGSSRSPQRRHDPRHVPVHGAGAARRAAKPTRAPTSSRSARCSTRWPPARRAFDGKTQRQPDRRDPGARSAADPPTLQPLTPPALERIVRTCLREGSRRPLADRARRAARAAMDREATARRRDPGAVVRGAATTPGSSPRRDFSPLSAAALVHRVRRRRYVPRAAGRVSVSRRAPPHPLPLLPLLGGGAGLAPRRTAASPSSRRSVWARPASSSGVRARAIAAAVTGTDEALFPFWSPEASLAFFADGKLMRIDLCRRRPPVTICDAPRGARRNMARDGMIVFSCGRQARRYQPRRRRWCPQS